MASLDKDNQKQDMTDVSPEVPSNDESEKTTDKLECAVCLQTCVQPVRLPCSHIFCYLCVKGVIHQSKRCAMCRQQISTSYLDNPTLISAEQPTLAFEGSYQWFYEGKNGWWQYDERTSTEIEAAYKGGEKQCEVLIAGFLYVIDFENSLQMRRNEPVKRRKIKRDLISIPKKGIAGIRLPPHMNSSTEDLPCVHNLDISDSDRISKAGADSGSSTSSSPGQSQSLHRQVNSQGNVPDAASHSCSIVDTSHGALPLTQIAEKRCASDRPPSQSRKRQRVSKK